VFPSEGRQVFKQVFADRQTMCFQSLNRGVGGVGDFETAIGAIQAPDNNPINLTASCRFNQFLALREHLVKREIRQIAKNRSQVRAPYHYPKGLSSLAYFISPFVKRPQCRGVARRGVYRYFWDEPDPASQRRRSRCDCGSGRYPRAA
jgi:hypothetical protein